MFSIIIFCFVFFSSDFVDFERDLCKQALTFVEHYVLF